MSQGTVIGAALDTGVIDGFNHWNLGMSHYVLVGRGVIGFPFPPVGVSFGEDLGGDRGSSSGSLDSDPSVVPESVVTCPESLVTSPSGLELLPIDMEFFSLPFC